MFVLCCLHICVVLLKTNYRTDSTKNNVYLQKIQEECTFIKTICCTASKESFASQPAWCKKWDSMYQQPITSLFVKTPAPHDSDVLTNTRVNSTLHPLFLSMTLMQWQLGLLIAHELQLSPVCDTKVFSFPNEATLQH